MIPAPTPMPLAFSMEEVSFPQRGPRRGKAGPDTVQCGMLMTLYNKLNISQKYPGVPNFPLTHHMDQSFLSLSRLVKPDEDQVGMRILPLELHLPLASVSIGAKTQGYHPVGVLPQRDATLPLRVSLLPHTVKRT